MTSGPTANHNQYKAGGGDPELAPPIRTDEQIVYDTDEGYVTTSGQKVTAQQYYDWRNRKFEEEFNDGPNTAPMFSNTVDFNGQKVFQRNDLIDPNLVDARGRTNLQRMEKGLAPIGPDGKSLNLHHSLQTNDSSLVEMTQTFHQQNTKTIHINPKTIPSGIDRKAFNTFKKEYWINRANDFR